MGFLIRTSTRQLAQYAATAIAGIVVFSMMISCDGTPIDLSGTDHAKDIGLTTVTDVDHAYLVYRSSESDYSIDSSTGSITVVDKGYDYYTFADLDPIPDALYFNAQKISSDGSTFYTSKNETFALDGKLYEWKYERVNGYQFKIHAPSQDVLLTSPRTADKLSRSKDILLKWNGMTDSSRAFVSIRSAGTSKKSISTELLDGGSYTFTAEALKGLENGKHTITVRRGYITRGDAPSTVKYACAFFTQRIINVELTD